MKLSVIIPLGQYEKAWQYLLPQLKMLPMNCEIIFAHGKDGEPIKEIDKISFNKNMRQIFEGEGRAQQMNAAARVAQGNHLWFLHADSMLAEDTVLALFRTLELHPDSLLYADLIFFGHSNPLMKVNQMGVWFRSHILGMPFGDQGLCIRREIFQNLGGYKENVVYGEDHLFVWQARQHGIKLCSINACLFTSARKYQERGWLKTTSLHLKLTFKQAWPEWQKLLNK